LGQTNSPTLARHEDGLAYIRIWVTPPRRLVFWDGIPSPSDSAYMYTSILLTNPNLETNYSRIHPQAYTFLGLYLNFTPYSSV